MNDLDLIRDTLDCEVETPVELESERNNNLSLFCAEVKVKIMPALSNFAYLQENIQSLVLAIDLVLNYYNRFFNNPNFQENNQRMINIKDSLTLIMDLFAFNLLNKEKLFKNEDFIKERVDRVVAVLTAALNGSEEVSQEVNLDLKPKDLLISEVLHLRAFASEDIKDATRLIQQRLKLVVDSFPSEYTGVVKEMMDLMNSDEAWQLFQEWAISNMQEGSLDIETINNSGKFSLAWVKDSLGEEKWKILCEIFGIDSKSMLLAFYGKDYGASLAFDCLKDERDKELQMRILRESPNLVSFLLIASQNDPEFQELMASLLKEGQKEVALLLDLLDVKESYELMVEFKQEQFRKQLALASSVKPSVNDEQQEEQGTEMTSVEAYFHGKEALVDLEKNLFLYWHQLDKKGFELTVNTIVMMRNVKAVEYLIKFYNHVLNSEVIGNPVCFNYLNLIILALAKAGYPIEDLLKKLTEMMLGAADNINAHSVCWFFGQEVEELFALMENKREALALLNSMEKKIESFFAPYALGKIDTRASITKLCKVAYNGGSWMLDSNVLALGSSDNPKALKMLRRIIKESEGNPSIRKTALTAIRQIKERNPNM